MVSTLQNTKNRKRYIEYESIHEISVTVLGSNYFTHDLKKKDDDE